MLMFTLQFLKIIICVEPLKFVVTYLKSNLVMIFCYTSISMPNINNSGKPIGTPKYHWYKCKMVQTL